MRLFKEKQKSGRVTNKKDKPSIFKQKQKPAGSQTKTTNSLFTKRPFTTQNMESEMAMDLCIDEKDEERGGEARPAVRAKACEGKGRGASGLACPEKNKSPGYSTYLSAIRLISRLGYTVFN